MRRLFTAAFPSLLPYFIMDLPDLRNPISEQTLRERQTLIPTEQEAQVYTSYLLGYLSLEEANESLHEVGRFIIALLDYPATSFRLA